MNFSSYGKIAILGFAREGRSVLQYLETIGFQGEVFILDRNVDNEYPDTLLNVSMVLGKTYLEALKQVDCVVKSPGISMLVSEIQEALDAGVVFTSASNIFFEVNKVPVIAVTGSKGKSSTATMVQKMLEYAGKKSMLIGNIGRSMLDCLQAKVDYFVVELSSQQLELFDANIEYGIFTSFFPDHMDYHGSFEKYMQAKFRFFDCVETVIVNVRNPLVLDYLRVQDGGNDCGSQNGKLDSKCIAFANQVNYVKDMVVWIGSDSYDLSDSKIKGEDMLCNFLGVFLLGRELGIPEDVIIEVASNFEYLQHRQQVIKVDGSDLIYVNDSASVTPESTLSALKAFSDLNIQALILGGLDRGYDYTAVIDLILSLEIPYVCVLPDLVSKIANGLKGVKSKVEVLECESLQACMSSLKELNFADGVVLFSPGAPSYNNYRNFYDRGEDFLSLI